MRDILPDSRPKTLRGHQFRAGAWWVPIYCANCGKPGGMVPEENMTFAFYLCTSPCAKLWGVLAGTMAMPDEVFWERVQQEQLESYGRLLSNEELLAIHAADASPLATLYREGA